MKIIKQDGASAVFDPALCALTSLCREGKEYIRESIPLFEISLLDREGNRKRISGGQAQNVTETADGAVYSGFPVGLTVRVTVSSSFPLRFGIAVENNTDLLCEWIDYPRIGLPPLKKNGGEGELLFPYNEGMLIDDIDRKEKGWSPFFEPVYPSSARYCVFPNMLCSQFLCYLSDGGGLYFGMEDEKHGVKQIDLKKSGDCITTVFRSFCGGDFGKGAERGFDTVVSFFDGGWEAGAAIYREWFEKHLPVGASKTAETASVPEWVSSSPLVVTYPVRGIHDMDKMEPNALYPYTNALPVLDGIAGKTGCRLMALLMHWEGTAPWAPPYVWPPFGGTENFFAFRDALHERGHLLGVYCSGFGYTLQSNLLPFNLKEEIAREGTLAAMTADEKGNVQICRTCTGQRQGYDICVANGKAKEILDRAYSPLFESGIDYSQILDQNHGGGQYLCYARDHDHPPCPGDWMTEEMQKLLLSWNEKAGKMLLGCESAAAEPFIGMLRMSDNRFELDWNFGSPVPMYAFLYHEYLRNFMGNQCACELSSAVDTLCLRLAYSYTAGDVLTLVLFPNGELMCNWGTRDFEHRPDKEKTLAFIASLKKLSDEGADRFLVDGRMIPAEKYECADRSYPTASGYETTIPDVFSTAWEKDGERVQIFVNHTEEDARVRFAGSSFLLPARSGVMKLLG